jgi:prefoldin subunit 5
VTTPALLDELEATLDELAITLEELVATLDELDTELLELVRLELLLEAASQLAGPTSAQGP